MQIGRKSISAVMAIFFCAAAVASPVLVEHEAVGHADAKQHHAPFGAGPDVCAHHSPRGDHQHSQLSEAVSMRSAHPARDMILVSGAVTAVLPSAQPFEVSAPVRPIAGPPRDSHLHSITTVLRL